MKRRYTRKGKSLRRGILLLVLAALLALAVYINRIHTPEAAIRAAENRCGTADTEVIARHQGPDAAFYLCRNESTLLVARFQPWMDPARALDLALDLTKGQAEAPAVATWYYASDPNTGQEHYLVAGKCELEGAVTLRAWFDGEPWTVDAPTITTNDGQRYFWLWLEGEVIETWEDGTHFVDSSLPNLVKLALLDEGGETLYQGEMKEFIP